MSTEDNDNGDTQRRSVTVPLPSGRGLTVGISVLLAALLVATVIVEAVRLHDLSHDKSKLRSELAQLSGSVPTGTLISGSSPAGMTALQQSALTAATTYAAEFATYNYNDFDSQLALVESHSVDPFLTQYKRETAQLQPDIVKAKSVSTGKVISAGVASITPTKAVVDVFLNQTIGNSGSSTPRVDSQRVEMTLTRRGNQWLISNVLLP
jgi:Mce-associated membrane protein